ncbi:oxidoreductase [Prescottella equi]|jgi:predicted dehydrogenase|uniref:Gfo/Idh/MocA family oxidoreductase n=1 Tax=Rhodococcus qingshengii TaxID=334542 RepID=A0A2A5JHU0_RHOSG|nr:MULTISPECIES: Gfo/Idh/MocA family oxidoreductase [Rhodococcus]OCC21225.1 oxidoreductase [Prescottella equi]ALU67971.1 oxidoreductase [Rhodococcus erythropolis R138]EME20276.1 oxidoreductase [Rhodococcus qingshengii BKS 20-40]MBF7735782.1 Gfo/Idh/MocA family oxidoreductase [Rhodococcus erythropolis]MBP1050693.1 Gfo/Idh/MocA family oxidoreductase [Rhodococcus qingshengii]
MTASKPRIALVGSGQMGSLHARVIAQSPLCELDLLIEPREEQGKAVAARFDTRWAADFDSLDGIDAVVIAAATPAHYELAGRVLDLGKPVLVEKPLAATYEQSVDLVDRSRASGVPLMCGLLERFNPAVRTAREFSGDVWQVNGIRHSPFVSRIPTGVATDLLIHDIDLAIGFAGSEPSLAKGEFGYFHPTSVQNRSEDCADAVLRFGSGAVATISASRISQRKIRQLSLLEADRLIEIDLLRRDITIYRHIDDNMPTDRDGYQQQTVIEIPTIRYSEEPLAAQLTHFLGLVQGTGDADGERASILPAHRAVHEVTESALAAALSS